MNIYYPWKTGNTKACVLATLCCSILGIAHAETSLSETSVANFTFRDGQTHTRKVSEIDGLLIAEQDMIMGTAASGAHTSRQLKGLSNSTYGRVWPNGIVPYRLSTSLSDSAKSKVREAVDHWNSFKAVTLVERTSANASAYPDYIDFVYENRCASWIGYQGNGAQSIYTGDKCSTGTLIHEIGHALGLLHEHTRSDRDQYVNIHWDRIEEDMEVNFEIMDGSVLLGEYDYGSIMHYGEYFFSRNGLPTIEPLLQTDARIGQRIETSQGDRDSVAALYRSNLLLSATSDLQAEAGQPVDLILQATNISQSGANSLSITVPVPDNTELLYFSSSSWSCEQPGTGATITCNSPVLAVGASTSVTLNLSTPAQPGTITWEATLTNRTHDTDLSNNNDSATVTLVAGPVNPTINQDATPEIASALDGGGGTVGLKLLAFMALLLAVTKAIQPQAVRVGTQRDQ